MAPSAPGSGEGFCAFLVPPSRAFLALSSKTPFLRLPGSSPSASRESSTNALNWDESLLRSSVTRNARISLVS